MHEREGFLTPEDRWRVGEKLIERRSRRLCRLDRASHGVHRLTAHENAIRREITLCTKLRGHGFDGLEVSLKLREIGNASLVAVVLSRLDRLLCGDLQHALKFRQKRHTFLVA